MLEYNTGHAIERLVFDGNTGAAAAAPNNTRNTDRASMDSSGLGRHLNLLGWSPSNVVAVALDKTVYCWNAANGSTSALCTLADEADLTSARASTNQPRHRHRFTLWLTSSPNRTVGDPERHT